MEWLVQERLVCVCVLKTIGIQERMLWYQLMNPFCGVKHGPPNPGILDTTIFHQTGNTHETAGMQEIWIGVGQRIDYITIGGVCFFSNVIHGPTAAHHSIGPCRGPLLPNPFPPKIQYSQYKVVLAMLDLFLLGTWMWMIQQRGMGLRIWQVLHSVTNFRTMVVIQIPVPQFSKEGSLGYKFVQ